MLTSLPVTMHFLMFASFVVLLINITRASSYEGSATQRCQNPNGHDGECVSIYECPAILGIIVNKLSSDYAFARHSQCYRAHGRKPHVCCTIDTGFVERSELNGGRIIFPDDDDTNPFLATPATPGVKHSSDIFPKPPVCGPISVVNKIYGGEEAEFGEFPWLANLEYRTVGGDLVSVCSGNVIHQRYLVTAAHCVRGAIEQKVGKLVSLRVGDHNTQSAIDCNHSGCIDTYQRLNVESLIPHPNFNSAAKKIFNHHDIALVRTDRNIIFTDTVAPICLPDVLPSLPDLRPGMRLTVAGWGHNGTVKFTSEKRKVEVPYVENSECPYKVAAEQLCAGGEFRKDSCTGDSGGSLARLTPSGWILEGLVSYGRGCGLETPAIYTRVRSYIAWIYKNIEN